MSDKSNDPLQTWHTMLAEFEKGFNAMATQVMGTEQFSRATHQLTGASVGAQKTMRELMERYLVSMNLPSRAQVVSLGERLQAIEGQLNEIKALLNQVHGNAVEEGFSAPRPPRTKQPPSASGGGTP